MKSAILILWPSFIVGGVGEVIFFTVFDPKDLYLFGEATSLSRLAVYSIGFFLCRTTPAPPIAPRPTG